MPIPRSPTMKRPESGWQCVMHGGRTIAGTTGARRDYGDRVARARTEEHHQLADSAIRASARLASSQWRHADRAWAENVLDPR